MEKARPSLTLRRCLIGILLLAGGLLVAVHLTGSTAKTDKTIHWPYEIDNFAAFVADLDEYLALAPNNGSTLGTAGESQANYENIVRAAKAVRPTLSVSPIEHYKSFSYLVDVESCEGGPSQSSINVIFIVKTAVNNYTNRLAIRRTWAQNGLVAGLFKFRTLFMVGACAAINPVPSSLPKDFSPQDCQRAIQEESARYGDVIQVSAEDYYYNTAIKNIMTLQWVAFHCPAAHFYLGIDDDYAFEVDNFAKFLRTYALQQNGRLDETDDTQTAHSALVALSRRQLLAGNMQANASPYRNARNKWYVSYEEYPYQWYPNFVSGGLILLSARTTRHFFLAAHFSKLFKTSDDVNFGLLAYKLGFEPAHMNRAYCEPWEYLHWNQVDSSQTECIGVHEFDSLKMLRLWARRRSKAAASSRKTSSNT